ncbi:MAG: methyltransferase [Rhodospirillaceae bacterium]|mgnify:FL=1|jgi:O-methyltransferase|nr:methyltransferase [Rhodospirillaceae bacterium]MBT4489276.1 methyltransferase [Rhodospirillaceae bacterium]MBT5195345.1 methyltransferase [Rhodospirillaceae bacterium]MBT5897300.1 methyltransferase [Rhodospirillaceae bacterium]MBT6427731.1 methyltransferase [Rhodospirillaceae bacterium]
MSFYGPPREQLGTVVSGLTQVEEIYQEHGLSTFMQDNLVALMRNEHFVLDDSFVAALLGNADGDSDASKIWRLHTCCWAARSALAVDGDFVECGTYQGFYTGVITQYLQFMHLPRQFYLYDSFAGLPEQWSTEMERTQANPGYEWDGVHQAVIDRFAVYPNVRVVKGIVPEVFDDVLPERIAFLHMDLNAGAAETAALDRLLPLLSDGAMVVLDDFGRLEQRELCKAHVDWWSAHGHSVLELPTGQGLVTFRKSAV